MELSKIQKLFFSLLSGIILSIGWADYNIGWIIAIGFIPLLFIIESLLKEKNKLPELLLYSTISFLIWNGLSSWWIYNASLPGAIAAVLLSTIFMNIVITAFFLTTKSMGRRIGYLGFVFYWISFEYLFMNSEISWPWLILGNSLANNVEIIQWYEFFGHIGGSIWILIINLSVYEIIRFIITKIPKIVIIKYSIFLSLVILVPIISSLYIYHSYDEEENPVDIVIIQPNIDSYFEKYQIPVEQQINNIIDIAKSKADENVDYFVAPETAIPNGMWEEEINFDNSIKKLRNFLANYPNAKLVIGADTRHLYYYGEGKSETARQFGSSEHFYDIYNTVLHLDTSKLVQIYHKSRLVPGVEMLPYPKLFWFLEDLMLDLGGIWGSHGTQKDRTVFFNDINNLGVGVPVCYESVYGEYVSEWAKNGASLLFIITNDGWWKKTPGYIQHHSFARIRAIETRRSIARSANTGISSFINERGDVLQYLDWNQRGAIRATLNANDKVTFYTKYGDFHARFAVVAMLILLTLQALNFFLTRIKNRRKTTN